MYYILNYIIVKISCQHTRRLFSIFLNYVLPLVQVWFKTAWHLPFCFKSHFCKSPQTIEKSEQFRCHLNHSLLLEAPPRFELGHKGVADLCLTTWLWRHTWWLDQESNQGHEDFQSSALPTELSSHIT